MTKPTEAQIKEAWSILGLQASNSYPNGTQEAFQRVLDIIAQRDAERAEHEAFRQRVSEALEAFNERVEKCGIAGLRVRDWERINAFVIPVPKPTPEEALAEAIFQEIEHGNEGHRQWLKDALLNSPAIRDYAKRGHHVAPIKDQPQ